MPRTVDDKNNCACGGSYLDSHRAKHYRTKKHQGWDRKTRNQHQEQGGTISHNAATTPPERLNADGDLREDLHESYIKTYVDEAIREFELKLKSSEALKEIVLDILAVYSSENMRPDPPAPASAN